MKIVGEVTNESGIYLITNITNGKIYVGSSVNLRKRRNEHKSNLKNEKHVNMHLQNAWKKYGEKNFTFSIIELVYDINKLLDREQYWIDKLNACDREVGYNLASIAGSVLGRKMTEEQIIANRFNKNRIPILQFDLDGNLIREWFSIGEMSRELNVTKKRVCDALKHKRKFMDTYLFPKDKFSNDLLVSTLTQEKVLYNAKKVKQYDSKKVFIRTWDSIISASKSLNICNRNICACCKGIRKSAGGFLWSYVE